MNLKLSKLSSQGIEILWDYIGRYRLQKKEGKVPDVFPRAMLLEHHSEILNDGIIISDEVEFNDRYEFAKYFMQQSVSFWSKDLFDDPGLWSWLVVVYWRQFTARAVNRHEHYIPMIGPYHGRFGHERLDYRHCTRTPVQLYERFGEKSRFFLSGRSMSEMGDIIEQVLSRQDIFGNDRFINTIISHYSTGDGLPRKGCASEPKRKKLQNGNWSSAGKGGIRRLVTTFLPRIKLTYNVYELEPKDIIELAGQEFKTS